MNIDQALQKLLTKPSEPVSQEIYNAAKYADNLNQWLGQVYEWLAENDTDTSLHTNNPSVAINRIVLGLLEQEGGGSIN